MKLTSAVVVLCLLNAALAPACQARIGESRSQLEGRLLENRRGLPYPEEYLQEKFRRVPFSNLLHYLPSEGVELAAYHKKASSERVSRSELEGRNAQPMGWDLLVIYYRGKSVLEAYRRNGPPLAEAERDLLLAIQRGGTSWEPQDRSPLEAENLQPLLKPKFVRADEQLAALTEGAFVVIYSLPFEQFLIEDYKENAARNAPESIGGF